MLTLQSPDRTPMSFLAGEGEMAARIRAFDWTGHPIGPPATWPQSLRLALGICLNSAFPTAIYWGTDLRLLYNDAWSTIPGPRHPACFGEPAREVWSDIWHVIEPQFTRVIETGRGVFLDDQMLPMRRYGYEEETYWTYSLTPIRGEDGTIEGIFNTGQETTAKVLKQRQSAFLLEIIDTLRGCADAARAMDLACAMLGDHLGAIRTGIREIDAAAGTLPVTVEWTAQGVERAGHSLAWSDLGSVAARLKTGRVVRIDSTHRLDGPEAQAFARLGTGSALAVPWNRAATLSAVFFVHRADALPWTDDEIATVEQVFARLVQTIDEERTKAREKTMMDEIDHRARNMLGVSQALIRMTSADDVESFRKSVLERTRALGNTLQVLSESNWLGADLANLVEREVAPFRAADGPRITIGGPRVTVPPLKAQPISMAIHELVTNAVKYGGLSSPSGVLDVSWTLRPDGVLDLDWHETNETPATGVESGRSGFGTKLLDLSIRSQLGGELTRQIEDGRFRCRLEVPLSGGD